ncbi:unnamed protein product [Prunus armeniaca]
MILHIDKVQELLKAFPTFTIQQVPRPKNMRTDALASLGSALDAQFRRSMLVEHLGQPSLEKAEQPNLIQINEDPSWQDPIINYLVNKNLPKDKAEAKKIKQKAVRYYMKNNMLVRRSHLGYLLINCADNNLILLNRHYMLDSPNYLLLRNCPSLLSCPTFSIVFLHYSFASYLLFNCFYIHNIDLLTLSRGFVKIKMLTIFMSEKATWMRTVHAVQEQLPQGSSQHTRPPLKKTCQWQKEEVWSRTPPAQLANHLGSRHTACIFQHLRQGSDHQPTSDVRSATSTIHRT